MPMRDERYRPSDDASQTRSQRLTPNDSLAASPAMQAVNTVRYLSLSLSLYPPPPLSLSLTP